MHTKTVIIPSEDFHYNFSLLESTQEPRIPSEPEISFVPYFAHDIVLRAEFIFSVICPTVSSADPVMNYLKGAWHHILLGRYSLAFKYTDSCSFL